VPAYRTGSTDYRPKWGFYRGIASNLVIGDPYIEYRNVSAEELLLGDANRDGAVDTLDFNALAAAFGGTNKAWANGDFNADAKVDTLDFNILAARFGQTLSAPATAAATVPEPATLGIIFAIQAAFSCGVLGGRGGRGARRAAARRAPRPPRAAA